MKTSRAMVLLGKEKLKLERYAIPNIKENDCLIRVEMAGICGTDQSVYMGKIPVPYPVILGHEVVGVVDEIGENASRQHKVKKGDRVIVESICGCNSCYICQSGDYGLCNDAIYFGIFKSAADYPYLWGAYSDYMYLPMEAKVHKISSNISSETAILISAVLGNCYRWLTSAGNIRMGDNVVILGPGQQGLASVIIANEAGANNIVVVGQKSDQDRLELAKEFGANYTLYTESDSPLSDRLKEITGGHLADIVIDLTGNVNGPSTAVKLVKKKGTIVFPSLYGSNKEIPLIFDDFVLNEITAKFVVGQDYHSVERAIVLAEKNKYQLDKIVTHKLPLEKAEEALLIAANKVPGENAIKVALIP